jgi:hypothetical protein
MNKFLEILTVLGLYVFSIIIILPLILLVVIFVLITVIPVFTIILITYIITRLFGKKKKRKEIKVEGDV